MIELFWTDENIAELVRRWEQDQSAAIIAAALNTTRNAILGKVFRLGLSARKPSRTQEERQAAIRLTKQRQNEKKKAFRQKVREMEFIALEAIVEAPKAALRIPLMELRDYRGGEPNQCRYIADEPPGPDYIACGLETPVGASYCSHCLEIVGRSARSEFSEVEKMRRRARFIALGRNPLAPIAAFDHGDAA